MRIKSIFAIVVLLLTTISLSASEVNMIEESSRPTSRSLTIIPVAVDYSDPDLSTEFLYNVGTATITVTNDSGAVIYQTTVYASVGTTVTTSTEFWDSGTYKITIQIGTKSYSGYFDVVN